ncbi:MAG: ribonuclease P protein component [Candidatus Moraniibacteriota bacterium]
MVSPGFRLRKNADIERVFRKGKPFFSVFLGCRFVATPGAPLAAFSVSKKQFPTAVERNRLKRRLRESFRAHLKLGLVSAGEYVFFFTKQAKNPSCQEIRDAMRAIFAKIR